MLQFCSGLAVVNKATCPTTLKNTRYVGATITQVPGNSSVDCCDACRKTNDCGAYTFVTAGYQAPGYKGV